MTEARAILLIFAGSIFFMSVAVLGLRAASANDAAQSLGVIIPLILGSYGSSRVVMHYGSSGQRRRR
jgi:hypothetical protein